jgi:methionyl-tRNA formyltransferase
VKAAALDLGLPVTSTVDDALAVGADLGVVVAFGRIIPVRILAELPMVNLHFSLLPRWRGAAPVERALLAGDTTTGVDVMVVEEGLDTGGIYAEAEVPIGPDATAAELRAELVELGSGLLVRTLLAGLRDPRPQVGEPLYAEKLQPAEYELDWTRPAGELHRWVRLGGAWTTFRDKRLKVWRSALPPTGDGIEVPTGDGVIELLDVQPEGKPRMSAQAWANGARPEPGELGAAGALAEPS